MKNFVIMVAYNQSALDVMLSVLILRRILVLKMVKNVQRMSNVVLKQDVCLELVGEKRRVIFAGRIVIVLRLIVGGLHADELYQSIELFP